METRAQQRCHSTILPPSTHPIPFLLTFRAVQVEGSEGGQATFLKVLGKCVQAGMPQERVAFEEEGLKLEALAGGREGGRRNEGQLRRADGPDEQGEVVGSEVGVSKAEMAKEGEGVLLQCFGKREDGKALQSAMGQV